MRFFVGRTSLVRDAVVGVSDVVIQPLRSCPDRGHAPKPWLIFGLAAGGYGHLWFHARGRCGEHLIDLDAAVAFGGGVLVGKQT